MSASENLLVRKLASHVASGSAVGAAGALVAGCASPQLQSLIAASPDPWVMLALTGFVGLEAGAAMAILTFPMLVKAD